MTWYSPEYSDRNYSEFVVCLTCQKGYVRGIVETLVACPNYGMCKDVPAEPVPCELCGNTKIIGRQLARGIIQGSWYHVCSDCGYYGDSIDATELRSVLKWNRSNGYGAGSRRNNCGT